MENKWWKGGEVRVGEGKGGDKGCQSFISVIELSGTAIFSSITLSQNTNVQIWAPPSPHLQILALPNPPLARPPARPLALYLSVCPITRQSFSIKQINWLDILISVVFDLVEYITDVYIAESR